METNFLFPKPIISASWLYNNLTLNELIIIDATIKKVGNTSKENEDKKQIKNARYLDIKNVFSDTNAPYPNTMLSSKDFEREAQRLGVNTDSKIVVYDDHGIYSSARVWWMFTIMGFQNISILNGGLPAWESKDYPVQQYTKNKVKKGNFKANYQPQSIVYSQDVLRASTLKDSLIVDARSSERFLGLQPEPRKGIRGGHIPNSKSMPYTSLQENGKMKSSKDLEEMFNKINPTNKPLIFSCGSGITACVLALASTLSGNTRFRVYDGSWTEWASNLNLPVK